MWYAHKVIYNMIAQIKKKFEKLSSISNDFEFLSGHSLSVVSNEILQKHAANYTL